MSSPARTTITVSGGRSVRLSVIDTGAPAVDPRGTMVLIHGAGGDALQWKQQIAHFSRNYRVIAPDLRGHGQSEAPDSAYSLEEFLWDFSQVLGQLQVEEPFVLGGHSFGGPVVLTYAATNPQRVKKLLLVASAPEMRVNPLVTFLLRMPLPLRQLEQLRPVLVPYVHAPLFVMKRVLKGAMFSWNGWDVLPAVAAPTLVVGGQFDVLVPRTLLHRVQTTLPQARLEIIRYARHLPHLERPDAVNRQIEAFLDKRRSWRGESEE